MTTSAPSTATGAPADGLDWQLFRIQRGRATSALFGIDDRHDPALAMCLLVGTEKVARRRAGASR